MKTLTGTTDTNYQVRYATDPVYFIVIKWPTTSFTITGFNPGEVPYFGREAVAPYLLGSKRIIDIGQVDHSLNVKRTLSVGSVNVTLHDYDGHFRAYLKTYNTQGVVVDFRMSYNTGSSWNLSDATTLLTGYLSANMVWEEDNRVFKFTIDSLTTFDGVIGRNMNVGGPIDYMDANKRNIDWAVFVGTTPIAGNTIEGQNIAPGITGYPGAVSPEITSPLVCIKDENLTYVGDGVTYIASGNLTPPGTNLLNVKSTSTFPGNNQDNVQYGLAVEVNNTDGVKFGVTTFAHKTHPTTALELYVQIPIGSKLNTSNLGKIYVNFRGYNERWVDNFGYNWGSNPSDNTNQDDRPIEVIDFVYNGDYPDYAILTLYISVDNMAGCPVQVNDGLNVYVVGLPFTGSPNDRQTKTWIVRNWRNHPIGSTSIVLTALPSAELVAAWSAYGMTTQAGGVISYMSTTTNVITLSSPTTSELYFLQTFELYLSLASVPDDFYIFVKASKWSATQFKLHSLSRGWWTANPGAKVYLSVWPSELPSPPAYEITIDAFRGSYVCDRHVIDQNPFTGIALGTIAYGVQSRETNKSYATSGWPSYPKVRENANALIVILRMPPEVFTSYFIGLRYAGDMGWFEYNRQLETDLAPRRLTRVLKTFLMTYLPSQYVFDSSWTSGNAYSLTQQWGTFIAAQTSQRIWDVASQVAFEHCCGLVLSGNTIKIKYLIETTSNPTLSTSSSFNGIVTLAMIEAGTFQMVLDDNIDQYTVFKGVSAQWAQNSVKDWAKQEIYWDALSPDLRTGTVAANYSAGVSTISLTGFVSGTTVVGRQARISGNSQGNALHTINAATNPTAPTSVTFTPALPYAITTGNIFRLLPDINDVQGYKEFESISFISTCALDIMYRCLKFWSHRLGNTWKKLKFTTFYTALPIEIFDIIEVMLPDDKILGASGTTSVKCRVIAANLSPSGHSLTITVETPYRVGTSVIDPLYWTGPA